MSGIIKVGMGSALGAMIRVSIDGSLVSFLGFSPYLALAVTNLLGCFLAGAFFNYMHAPQTGAISDRWHFWGIGFCGGFTTFASFVILLYQGILEQRPVFVGIYSAFLIFGGILAFILGLLYSKRSQA